MHIPAGTIGAVAGVDRHHDALAAEAAGALGDQFRPGHRRGVEAHLVGTGAQQFGDALHAADATTHGERDGHGLGGAPHQIHQGAAALMAGGDVEEDQLVGAGRVVAAGQLHGITGIAQPDEIDAFDNPAIGHVEAGNDAPGDHGFTVKVAPLDPVAPVMSQAATSGPSSAVQIGSRVRITRVRDQIPAELVEMLQSDATGTVRDFKMTDGSGIGVVVELANGSTGWFFDDEIAAV